MNDSGERDYPTREVLADWSDERLVTGLKANDGVAAEAMVRAHGGWMLAVARRILKDDALAEDCVQEAFLNAFQKISGFKAQSRLKTWLHSIVVNQSLMKLRARSRYQEGVINQLLPEFDENACRIEDPWTYLAAPHEILEREETRQLVLSKISELPDKYRIVSPGYRAFVLSLRCSRGQRSYRKAPLLIQKSRPLALTPQVRAVVLHFR